MSEKRSNIIITILIGLMLWIIYICDSEMARYGIYTIFSFNIHEILIAIPYLSVLFTVYWLFVLFKRIVRGKNKNSNLLLLVILLILSIAQFSYFYNQSKTASISCVASIKSIDFQKLEIEIDTGERTITLDCPMLLIDILKTDGTEYYFTYECSKSKPNYGKLSMINGISGDDDIVENNSYDEDVENSINKSVDSYLYDENEEVLLSFQIADSNKFASICISENQQDYIIYRFGTKDKIELEYPLKEESSWNDFTYSYYIRGGGTTNEGLDLNYLHFINGGYTYEIYEEYYSDSNKPLIGIRVTNQETNEVTDILGESDSIKGTLISLRDNSKINIIVQ